MKVVMLENGVVEIELSMDEAMKLEEKLAEATWLPYTPSGPSTLPHSLTTLVEELLNRNDCPNCHTEEDRDLHYWSEHTRPWGKGFNTLLWVIAATGIGYVLGGLYVWWNG